MKRALLVAICSLPTFTAAAGIADSCLVCHKDALTLERWDATSLKARIKDLTEGRAGHPVPIPPLSEAELDMLAQTLAAH
jgi:hypothetical protein